MNKLITFFFLTILIGKSFSQANIAIISFTESEYKISKKVKKYLHRNQIHNDSIKTALNTFIIKEFEREKIKANHIQLNQNSVFTDTLIKRNTTRYKYNVQNTDFIKFVYSEISPPKIKYYSKKMNVESEQFLCGLIINEYYDYIVVLNRLKIYRKNWFSKKYAFQLHLEVFDNNLNVVLGEKIQIERKIFKKLYPSAFNQYLKSLIYESLIKFKSNG